MRVFKGFFQRVFRLNKGGAVPAGWLVKVNGRMDLRLRRFAEALGRRTQYWSRASWIVALALFIGLFGGCCLLLLWKAFIH